MSRKADLIYENENEGSFFSSENQDYGSFCFTLTWFNFILQYKSLYNSKTAETKQSDLPW